MKRGLNTVRCSTEGFHRLQLVEASSPAGFSLIELLAVAAILLLLFTLYWGSGSERQPAAPGAKGLPDPLAEDLHGDGDLCQ